LGESNQLLKYIYIYWTWNILYPERVLKATTKLLQFFCHQIVTFFFVRKLSLFFYPDKKKVTIGLCSFVTFFCPKNAVYPPDEKKWQLKKTQAVIITYTISQSIKNIRIRKIYELFVPKSLINQNNSKIKSLLRTLSASSEQGISLAKIKFETLQIVSFSIAPSDFRLPDDWLPKLLFRREFRRELTDSSFLTGEINSVEVNQKKLL
jgi:hypothetical protein